MKDKMVINAISKIYFIIISFLSFILLASSLVFIVLQNGVYFEQISLPNIKVKQLYIKWEEKINISVKDIQILKSSSTTSEIDYKSIKKGFTQAQLFVNWFDSVVVEKIRYKDIEASFKYSNNNNGYLLISSKKFKLKSSLFFDSHMLVAQIDELIDEERNITLSGKIILSPELKIIATLDADINKDILLNIALYADKENLFYKVKSKKSITKIAHAIKIANLPKEVKYWAFDAIKMSQVKLLDMHGWVNYQDLGNAYKNIYINSQVEDLHYTYNPELDAVHAKKTILKFENGSLKIYPKNAYSYKQKLGKSWINIDFTKKEELLNLYLVFNGKLNKNMLKILAAYKIDLPFLQKKGTIKTDLNIAVGLRTIDVNAKGDFFTKKANFDYLGLNLDIFDTYVRLDNYDVTINKMYAKYKNIIDAKVKVKYNAKKATGKINFKVQRLAFKKQNLSLKTKNLSLVYNIIPNKDNISIEKSEWNFIDKSIKIQKLKVPFDLEKLIVKIPTTTINIEDIATLYAAGNIDIRSLKTDLNIDLLTLNYKGIKLAQSTAQAKVTYDKDISIKFNDTILLSHAKTDYMLKNLSIDLLDEKIKVKSLLSIDKIVKSKAIFIYNISKKQGLLSLKYTEVKDKDLGSIFSKKGSMNFTLKQEDELFILESKHDDLIAVIAPDSWFFNIGSVKKISKYSAILKRFKITNGDININKYLSQKINFNASFKYPFKLIVVNNKPVSNYDVYGTYDTKKKSTLAHINNKVHVAIAKDIKITTKNIGLDINELIKAIDSKDARTTKGKNIIAYAKDSYLYISKNRHVVSDSIEVQYFNNILTAQLLHAKGKAGFKFHDKEFFLYGENFNDYFMEKLFALSRFKGGNLSFSMEGTTKEYEGIFNIKDTIIVDYKILNNVLAFINTIPSLITFTLPDYNKHGLKVKSAYVNFTSKNDIFDISDIKLDSEELDIFGRGNASFTHNSINLELSLKTDLGSSASKIPIVGYILFDEDSMSTSLSVTGKLTDPQIKSLIAKEIIVNPLNIIKRTILLPYHLLSDINMTETEEDFDISE